MDGAEPAGTRWSGADLETPSRSLTGRQLCDSGSRRATSARRGHAVISGGSSGIGLALGRRLASAGWNLTLIAQDPGRLAFAAAELESQGIAVRTAAVDVTDATGVERAMTEAVAALGPVNLLVACAGIVVPGRLADQPPDAFARTMAVNYLGAVHLVRSALPHLPRHGDARIVLVASGAALIGLYGYTSYAPSKFAVRGLAEALRSELAPEGIGGLCRLSARHRHAGLQGGAGGAASDHQPARRRRRLDDDRPGRGCNHARDRPAQVHHSSWPGHGCARSAAQLGGTTPTRALVRSDDPPEHEPKPRAG